MMKNETWVRWMEAGAKLGCHQMPERSFFYQGYQFPVCARCTGVIISSFLAFLVFFKKKIPYAVCTVMSGVMLADWLLQYLKIKESSNRRRLLTGLVGGFGYATLHLYFYRFVIHRWMQLFRKDR